MSSRFPFISSEFTGREILSLFSLTGACALLLGCPSESALPEVSEGDSAMTRPNIIFVMTDDHAHGQMSNAGDSWISTPGLDRLAKEGVRFANAFVTNSLCAPSRATILTGTYSSVHGVMGNSEAPDREEFIDPSLPTFPQMLQSAGYQTGIVGKWHLRHDPRGFDHWSILPGQGLFFDPDFIVNGNRLQIDGYVTDIITDMALDYLDSIDHSEPFLLVYQHKAPHRPFTPAPRHQHLYEDIDLPYPETFWDDFSTRLVAGVAKDMLMEESLADDYEDLPHGLSSREKREWIYQQFVKDHYRAMHAVDEGLVRVLDYLDDHGLAEDTLIIYTTDNGFYLGEYGWYDKRFMYEPSFRVPLLMRYPNGIEPNQVVESLAVNIDIAPTILDFADLLIPEAMQGESLRPLVQNEDIEWRNSVYYSYYENSWALRDVAQENLIDPSFDFFTAHIVGPHRGIRTEQFKLIEFYTVGEYWEFFDLNSDPNELKNLYYATDAAHSGIIDELKRELRRSQKKYQDIGTWDDLIRPDYRDPDYTRINQ